MLRLCTVAITLVAMLGTASGAHAARDIQTDLLYDEIKSRWTRVKRTIIEENLERLLEDFGPSVRVVMKDMLSGVAKVRGDVLKDRLIADLVMLYSISQFAKETAFKDELHEDPDSIKNQENGPETKKILKCPGSWEGTLDDQNSSTQIIVDCGVRLVWGIDIYTAAKGQRQKIRQDFVFVAMYEMLADLRNLADNTLSTEQKYARDQLSDVYNGFGFSKTEAYAAIFASDLYKTQKAEAAKNKTSDAWTNSSEFGKRIENTVGSGTASASLLQRLIPRASSTGTTSTSELTLAPSKLLSASGAWDGLKMKLEDSTISSFSLGSGGLPPDFDEALRAKVSGAPERYDYLGNLLRKLRDELPLGDLCNAECNDEFRALLTALQKLRSYVSIETVKDASGKTTGIELEFNGEEFVKEYAKEFERSLFLKRGWNPYLAIGLSGGQIRHVELDCIDDQSCRRGQSFNFYSEKLGLKYVWRITDTDTTLHTNLHAGGLLFNLKSKEEMDQPFDPNGFYVAGIDPIGVNYRGIIELNVTVQWLWREDQRTAFVGFNTAIPLLDYFNLITE